MKQINFIGFLILISLAFSCKEKPNEETVSLRASTLDLSAISNRLMQQINITPGEKVFMVGMPGEFDSVIVLLSDRINAAGGVYMGTINVDTTAWPESWNNDFVKSTKGKSKEELIEILSGMDLGIMLPGPVPADAPYGAWQEIMKKQRGRAVHFHWAGAFDITGKGVAIDSAISKIYENAVLNSNYNAIAAQQAEFESAIRRDGVVVTNPAGTNISFRIGDRPVTKQDGDASKLRSDKGRNLIDREVEIPAGAIRVSPLEETVEGVIVFPNGMWGDQKVEGLTVTFKKGKITDIKATEGLETVKTALAPGREGYLFRELVVGFNPLLAMSDTNPNILYYGYGAGIVRLSFGNSEEIGGLVRGDFVKINFFTDAMVIVGGDIWVKDGKLIK